LVVELLSPVEPLVLGDVALDELVLGDVDELELPLVLGAEPPAAPVVLEPDLLKKASHSARETCPSLLVSAAEKFGADVLAELLPDADGDDVDGDDVDGDDVDDDDVDGDDVDGVLEDEEEDCATASVDSAKSTAALMMLRVLGMGEASNGW